jgi:hypothetical protein
MPTRLYFPASDAAAVSPAFDSSWTYVSEALRRKLADTKGSSAITIGTQIGPWTPGQKALDRQYVSTRMNAGIAFTFGATYKAQLMVREYNNGDNVTTVVTHVRIVSEDGNTVRRVLSASDTNVGSEFINNVTHRNKSVSSTNLVDGLDYTTVLGDRLVIELGYNDTSGATPEASAKWGENATDLPENETQTTDGAGWIEFSNTITFAGESANLNIQTDLGQLIYVGLVPTVVASDHKNITTSLGETLYTGFAPVVTVALNIPTGLGEAVYTGLEPTVSVTQNQNIVTGLGEVTYEGFAPTVSVSDHKNIQTGLGEVQYTGLAPTIQTPQLVVTNLGELVYTGLAPTVTIGNNTNVQTGFGEVVYEGLVPTVSVSDHKNIVTGLGELVFTGYESVVETPVNISTALGQLIYNGFEPTVSVSDHKVIVTDLGELIFNGFSPTVSVGGGAVDIQTNLGELIYVGLAPTVVVGPVINEGSPVSGSIGGNSRISTNLKSSRINDSITLNSTINV